MVPQHPARCGGEGPRADGTRTQLRDADRELARIPGPSPQQLHFTCSSASRPSNGRQTDAETGTTCRDRWVGKGPSYRPTMGHAARDLRARMPDLAMVMLSQRVGRRHSVELVSGGNFGCSLKYRVFDVDDFLDAPSGLHAQLERRHATAFASRATASATGGPNMTSSLWLAPRITSRSTSVGAWSATRALSSVGTTESRSP